MLVLLTLRFVELRTSTVASSSSMVTNGVLVVVYSEIL